MSNGDFVSVLVLSLEGHTSHNATVQVSEPGENWAEEAQAQLAVDALHLEKFVERTVPVVRRYKQQLRRVVRNRNQIRRDEIQDILFK